MGAQLLDQFIADLAATAFTQHLLALRQGRVGHFDHQVEAADMGRVDGLDAVAEPETRQRVLLQHAVDPAFLRAVAGGRLGGLEDIFDLVEHQHGTLRMQHAVGRAQGTQALLGRHRVALAVGAGDFVQRAVQAAGDQARQLRLAGAGWAVQQHIHPWARLGQGFAQVAFGDHQRLADMAVMLPAQVARRARPECVGEQLQRRSFAETHQAWQVGVAQRQHRTQRHRRAVAAADVQQPGAHQRAVMGKARLDLRHWQTEQHGQHFQCPVEPQHA
ncbi:hypothetical protein D3C76_1008630 [compost metagenome]